MNNRNSSSPPADAARENMAAALAAIGSVAARQGAAARRVGVLLTEPLRLLQGGLARTLRETRCLQRDDLGLLEECLREISVRASSLTAAVVGRSLREIARAFVRLSEEQRCLQRRQIVALGEQTAALAALVEVTS